MKKIFFICLLGSLSSWQATAQGIATDSTSANQSESDASTPEIPVDSVIVPEVRKSPLALAMFKSTNAYIKVIYGQPYKRGRQVFGDLEPYGKIWRCGANEATEITLTKDVKFGGKPLAAGTYTIFAIPEADKWTIIINAELGQLGAFKYQPEKDLFSVEASVASSDFTYEAFTILFEETKTGADLVLIWDTTRVAVPLTFDK